MRAQAEIQYDGDFDDVCNDTSQSGIMFADAFSRTDNSIRGFCLDEDRRHIHETDGTISSGSTGAGIDSNGSAWAASVRMRNGEWFCVDALGSAQATSSLSIGYLPPIDKTC